MWGLDTDGKPYVHVRIYKANRLYGEVFSKHTIQLTCRDCFRKLNILIKDKSAVLTKTVRAISEEVQDGDRPA